MSNWAFLAILAGLVLVYVLLSRTKEGFALEFVDRSNEKRTDATRASSYNQETNHFKPTVPLAEATPGVPTPYRVNMFDSYIPA
jgi:ABC-type uncharacterized transport system permease subunit|uniref:Uncharacterized protein n=1 Tax=viral metagenome TaxID=1070528 RepID=A0A6C0AJH0_9ZZZZ